MLSDATVSLILAAIEGLRKSDIGFPEVDDESDEACFLVQCDAIYAGVKEIINNENLS